MSNPWSLPVLSSPPSGVDLSPALASAAGVALDVPEPQLPAVSLAGSVGGRSEPIGARIVLLGAPGEAKA